MILRSPFNHQHTESRPVVEAIFRLQKVLLSSLDFNTVIAEVVNSVFQELGFLKLGYEIVVLCLIDEHDKTLKRISVSQTEKAKKALQIIPIPFNAITIPLSFKENLLIKAIETNKPQICTSWPEILVPSLKESDALAIQKQLGIKASLVYPITSNDKVLGTLILSMNKPISKVTKLENAVIEGFSNIVGLAVQNASLYSQISTTNKQLKKANTNLKHLDKIKDEFVFIATHELKNPVTAMRGYLSMFQEGSFGEIPDTMKDPMNQLQASNQQLVELVNDLLQIARTEAKTLTVHTEPINLCPIVDIVKESLKPLSDQKSLSVVHYCPNPMPQVQADTQRVKEIINNLLSNAIKYSDSGTITISHEVNVDKVITHVSDQGVGISPEDQQKLFTRFFRAEEEAAKGIPGTGLGLFIVKQLIEKMGGTIWLTTEKGKGSTFSFSLPLA